MPRDGVSGDLQIAYHEALAIIERMCHAKRACVPAANELKDGAVERLLARRDGHFTLHRIDRRLRKKRECSDVVGMRQLRDLLRRHRRWEDRTGEHSKFAFHSLALLFRTTPATIHIIANAGAMLKFGQKRTQGKCGLSSRARL
jgi:hypothetical protein